ncbi:hypothetical protein OS493_033350 [Desmophyllum pertusum]|uniref:Uncharacterized protein n=1 Tax=Desmophyllum pertusum TaxID=174260 RepID=A0A9W9YVR8_9CNID|nr:hypothetical protein OS493_033350 [Desmophyllum pertusum]
MADNFAAETHLVEKRPFQCGWIQMRYDPAKKRKVDSEESPVNSKAAAIRPSSTKDLEPDLDFEEPPVNYEADAAKSKTRPLWYHIRDHEAKKNVFGTMKTLACDSTTGQFCLMTAEGKEIVFNHLVQRWLL